MDTNSLIARVTRALRFDASVYREIAADAGALPQALTVVVAASILSGLGAFGRLGQDGIVTVIIFVVLGIIGVLIGFAIYAAVAALLAQMLFQGKTNFQEMARTLGFAYVWNGLGILGIIPLLGGFITFVGTILAVISGVLALRESAEFDTTKAVVTAVIAGLVAGFATFCTTAIVGVPIAAALGVLSGNGQ